MTKRNKWTEFEITIMIDNYSKGMDYVKNLLPNRTRWAISKKAKFLNLNVDKDNLYYNIDVIKKLVRDSFSFAEVFRKLNKSKSGDSYKVIKNFIHRNNIDISHFDPWKNNRFNNKKEKPISFWLNIETNINSSHLKDKLYKNRLKERKCELCGQSEEWFGKKISLILDHINGISNDNRIENLRIVCPNCNATLETHCRGSKCFEKVEKIKTIKEIKKPVRKVERPPYKQLLSEISKFGYAKTGKLYGVSDNSIRKWVKMYEKHGENF